MTDQKPERRLCRSFAIIWERRDRPRHEWSGEPSSPPVPSTNAPAENTEQDSAFDW